MDELKGIMTAARRSAVDAAFRQWEQTQIRDRALLVQPKDQVETPDQLDSDQLFI